MFTRILIQLLPCLVLLQSNREAAGVLTNVRIIFARNALAVDSLFFYSCLLFLTPVWLSMEKGCFWMTAYAVFYITPASWQVSVYVNKLSSLGLFCYVGLKSGETSLVEKKKKKKLVSKWRKRTTNMFVKEFVVLWWHIHVTNGIVLFIVDTTRLCGHVNTHEVIRWCHVYYGDDASQETF